MLHVMYMHTCTLMYTCIEYMGKCEFVLRFGMFTCIVHVYYACAHACMLVSVL